MNTHRSFLASLFTFCLLLATAQFTQGQLLWTCGLDDNSWPMGTGGGADTSFVQENGSINPLPGSQFSTSDPHGADNDYYFAGQYTEVIPGNGTYDPVGVVDVNEEAAERAFAADDLDLRYHFNLPATLKGTNLLSVTFDALNLDTDEGAPDPRMGISVFFNGVEVQKEIVIRNAQLDTDYTTPPFTLDSVNAKVGPGFDNIVSLRGTSYSSDGGGNWMGIDYVQLNQETTAVPQPVLPWSVGRADNSWAVGDGGGINATFVEGNGTVNALPGSATSTEVKGGADNDYYLAGVYTNVLAGNGTYTPIGLVKVNEEAAERGFAGAETELRYHFNLPASLQSSDTLAVTFGAINLDTTGSDPRYGVEVYVNGVRVQSEVLVRAAQLNTPIMTTPFTVASVNARLGIGQDNIVSLRGISHKPDGGGDALGIDYVSLKLVPKEIALPWSVGIHDNGWPAGSGGGVNTAFVQENGTTNPLPGTPNSPKTDKLADNDYYFAGAYTKVIASNGTYDPVGDVPYNEEAAERALTPSNTELRYHFNLPSTLNTNTLLSVSFSPNNLEAVGDEPSVTDPHYGIEVFFNNVLVQTQIVVRAEEVNHTVSTTPFSLAKVNAQVGPGYDNIVTLKGIDYSADGGGNWMGIDYVELSPVLPSPFPWSVGRDDNAQGFGGVGGGPNTSFVQENGGTNDLPGNPASPEVNQQADDDYYFAGEYTKVITANGDYTPIGSLYVNEEVAERAFAGSDNTKRYHFNLPTTLKPTDQLVISYDAYNLDTGGTDPQYGVEVYFNSVLVQPEVIIKGDQIDADFTTPPFTLATVKAEVGPGWDNIVTLQGINHNDMGGGNWMGIDYVQLDPLPTPVFPWAVGRDDNGWPTTGSGGGPNANFVQENGTVNDLPGNAHNHVANQQADNDYYFAGVYSNAVPSVVAAYGPYTPVGIVPRNEEAAERAFTSTDTDLRYHFNLPSTLSLTNQVTITYDVLNLEAIGDEASVTDPHFGIEVYFNSVKVQPEIIIRTNDLGVAKTTAPFTLASVNAQLGAGADNIVSLKGITYSADGGGNWMGFDYVKLDAAGGSGEQPRFTAATASNGKLTLTWTGNGTLEWAPALIGSQWTPVTPAPTASTYTEDIVLGQRSRFYRLKQP